MNKFTINDLTMDEIVRKCIHLYLSLPKSGKPREDEWTVLSCIIKYNINSTRHEIVALGTGSKCVGSTKMSPEGKILNDSHAEVIARRSFLLYLYDNIMKLLSNKKSIFLHDKGKFKLKDGIMFLFYSSQMPCGDASIILKTEMEENDSIGEIIPSGIKHKIEIDICEIERKRIKLEDEDIHRTGAKCLPYTMQDPKLSGKGYHLLGPVRIKPGRGERTLSVSCSDKMARWVHVGIQGSLLDILLCEPIYIRYFIFGAGVPYSDETLRRAFLDRDSKNIMPNLSIVPKFYQSVIKFINLKGENRTKPAPGSIVWVQTSGLVEVAVQGQKLGVTKKKSNSLNGLCICKYNLYKCFLQVMNRHEMLKQSVCGEDILQNISYNEMKQKSTRYNQEWCKVKKDFFKMWTAKPDMWSFCVDYV